MLQAKRQVKVGALVVGLGLGLGMISIGCSGSTENTPETAASTFESQLKELESSAAANDAAAAQASKAARKAGSMPP